MSAMDKIRRMLPLDQPPQSGSPPSLSLSNLSAYIDQTSDQNSDQGPSLLESIRVNASLAPEHNHSIMDALDFHDLDQLISKFQNYQSNLRLHRDKLVPIESILRGFDSELDQLSSSLVELHEKSTKISSDSSSNRSIADKLNPIILDLIISPEIVKSIISEPVNAKWMDNLKFINEKLQLIASINELDDEESPQSNPLKLYKGSEALKQLASGVQLLVYKCIERIRDYMISQIKLLRSSTAKISSQAVQRNLLQIKDGYAFLQSHHPDLAKQLQLAYIYTMKWYYKVRFAKYIYALENLNVRHIGQNLVLGSTANEEKGLFGSGFNSWLSVSNSQKASPANPNQVTLSDYLSSVDKRMQILENTEESASAIPSQIAETTPFVYWLEFIYHQWSIALEDNIVVEYLFMVDFFYSGNEKFEAFSTSPGSESKHEWSQIMFEPVFKLGTGFVTWLISHTPVYHNKGVASSAVAESSAGSSCDAYAILLMIRMVQNTQSKMHNEFHIPILDDYLNSVLMILWPQFTKIIDLNCESLKKTILRTTKETSLAPVNVTQQFAQFVSGLLKLSLTTSKDGKQDFRGEPLFISISRLRNDFETVLTKLSNHFFGSKDKATEKELFLYNNFYLVESILRNENDTEANSIIDEQVQHFSALCNAYKK